MTKLSAMSLHDQKRLVEALYRQKLSAFIQRCFGEINSGQAYNHNWHVDAITWHLEQVANGTIKRLLITLPPRNLKSISASVAFPAWVLGHDPSKRIVCVSYANDLAIELSNKTRQILSSTWYRHLFPAMGIDRRKDTETEVRSTKGGYRFATTVGGALTGRGGSLIIIDDPMKAADANSETTRKKVNQWYDQTLQTRLDNKKDDAIILIMQRLHVEDLAGHVLNQEGWSHLNLPAIAEEPMRVPISDQEYYNRGVGELLHPAREPQHILDDLKRSMGSAIFSAQYQQQPVPADGNMVKWKWFERYTSLPEKTYRHKIVQSWDTASKGHELADYSACVTALVGKTDIHILNVYRDRLDYPELKKKIIAMRKLWKTESILIEDKGSGIGLKHDLKKDGIRSIPIEPKGDKEVRLSTCSAKIEEGSILIPNDAPWLDEFKNELLAFPNGKHDDQVDALSQLINWWRTKRTYTLDNVG